MKQYTINDIVYNMPEKGELILAQSEELSKFIGDNIDMDKIFNEDGLDTTKLLITLGAKMSSLMAIKIGRASCRERV